MANLPFFESGRTGEAARLLEAAARRIAEAVAASLSAPMPRRLNDPSDSLIPERGMSDDALLDLVEHVVEGSTRFACPGHLGHMDPSPNLASVIGAFLSAAINNNMLSREMSPLLSRLEERLMREIARDLFGMGDAAGGIMTSGGSLANLHCLCVARNTKLGTAAGGVCGLDRTPVILASRDAHTSIQKAAMVLGIGTDQVLPVETDEAGRMVPALLEDRIRALRAAGRAPFAVVATAGTTVVGAIDPLEEIAAIARKHDVWLHVDAIFGGALRVSRRHRDLLKGIESADSVTFNPHKWWYVARTCSLAMFRDEAAMRRHFRVPAPYMGHEDGVNLGEISLQGSRESEVLKLWLTLRHGGREGLERWVDHDMEAARRCVGELRRRPWMELAAEPVMNVICFRCAPPGMAAGERDRLNLDLHKRLLSQAGVFVSTPWHRGERWLKLVLLCAGQARIPPQAFYDALDSSACAPG